jgi:hypothetical protein
MRPTPTPIRAQAAKSHRTFGATANSAGERGAKSRQRRGAPADMIGDVAEADQRRHDNDRIDSEESTRNIVRESPGASSSIAILMSGPSEA